MPLPESLKRPLDLLDKGTRTPCQSRRVRIQNQNRTEKHTAIRTADGQHPRKSFQRYAIWDGIPECYNMLHPSGHPRRAGEEASRLSLSIPRVSESAYLHISWVLMISHNWDLETIGGFGLLGKGKRGWGDRSYKPVLIRFDPVSLFPPSLSPSTV